jgi:hypothetical protein
MDSPPLEACLVEFIKRRLFPVWIDRKPRTFSYTCEFAPSEAINCFIELSAAVEQGVGPDDRPPSAPDRRSTP